MNKLNTIIFNQDNVMSLINKLIVFIFILVISACSSNNDADKGMATIKVSIPGLNKTTQSNKTSETIHQQAVSTASVPAEIDSIVIEVLDEKLNVLDTADIFLSSGEVTLTIPEGKNYTVRGQGLNGSEMLFSGESIIKSIGAGENVSVSLRLEDRVQLSLTPLANLEIDTTTSNVLFNLQGLNDLSVKWYINGIEGGSAEFGTISISGQ